MKEEQLESQNHNTRSNSKTKIPNKKLKIIAENNNSNQIIIKTNLSTTPPALWSQ